MYRWIKNNRGIFFIVGIIIYPILYHYFEINLSKDLLFFSIFLYYIAIISTYQYLNESSMIVGYATVNPKKQPELSIFGCVLNFIYIAVSFLICMRWG